MEHMIEANTRLKDFILEAPASHDKHQKALGWLNEIHKHYTEKIKELEEKNESTS